MSVEPTFDDVEEAPPPRRIRKRWVAAGMVALFLALFGWLFVTAPLGRALEPRADNALILLSADGQPISRRGSYMERPVEVGRLPPHVAQAFLAIEDRRFYSHWGIDPRGLARAFVANARAGATVQGGSTITQQLAKNSFLSLDRSVKRKVQEVFIAFWLEAWLSKDEILSRYLSSVYFGDGAYGLGAAARTYFSTTPERLTRGQAAMLAGMVKAPSRLAPSRNLAGARARARLVVAAMQEAGYLTAAQARQVRYPTYRPGRQDLPIGSYFADWALPQVRAAMDTSYGEVRAATTLDSRLQRFAEQAVRRALDGSGRWQGASEAALVAMRPDGRVVALVGGRDYKASSFNRATQAMRQPGSSFKLFVYLAALENGFGLDSVVDDSPTIQIGDWAPKNDENKYRGPINLVTAFAASSNIAAIRLQQAVGTDAVIDEARKLGVKAYLNPWPSLALGTSPMPLIELTAAYAALAAGRYPVVPTALPVVARAGPMDWPARAPMLRLLETVIRNGTGSSARLPVRAYGKTGTTQNHRDALFVGFAGDLVVGVWVGNDDNTPMRGVSGRGLPAQIWRDFMRAALEREGVLNIPPPVDVAALEAAAASALEPQDVEPAPPPPPETPDGSTPERAIPVDPEELPPGAAPE